jgi:uncharacterized membrane protein
MEGAAVFWLTALAAALRTALVLLPEPFWYDEAFSALVAELPVDRLIVATAGDVHPPLYYLVLKAWLWLTPGASLEVAARSLSLVLSLLALVFYWELLKFFGLTYLQRGTAFILAAFMPGLVYFAAEARMYALLEVCVLGGLLSLLKGKPLLAGLFLGAGALTHNAGLLYAPVIAGAALLMRVDWRRVGLAAAVAGVVWLPWVPLFIYQLQATTGNHWIWMPRASTLAYMLFKGAFYLNEVQLSGMDGVFVFLLAGVTTYGVLLALRRDRWPLLILAFGVLFAAVGVSYVTGSGVLLHRMLMPSFFFLAVIWSILITRAREVGMVLFALLLAAFVFSDAQYFVHGRTMIDYELLEEIDAQAGDVIYTVNFAAVPLALYSDLPVIVAPVAFDGGMRSGLSRTTLAALDIPATRLEYVDWSRAWLMWYSLPESSPSEEHYVDDLLARYDAQLIDEAGSEYMEGGMWLLENAEAARVR